MELLLTCLIKFPTEVRKMSFCRSLVVLVVAAVTQIMCPVPPASAQILTDMYYKCSRNRNYTNGGAFESSLSSILSSMASNELGNGFYYNVSEGLKADRVYSAALCRGDLMKNVCDSCVNSSSHELMELCPNQKEAVMWSDDCMLRYSDQPFFGLLDFRYGYMKWNEKDGTDADLFNRKLNQLLRTLRDRAAAGNASLKYDLGEAKLSNNRTVYALVQCTPDLSEVLCGRCLDTAISEFPKRIPRKQGGKSLGASCTIRFQSYKFYDSQSRVALPLPSPDPPSDGKGKRKVIVMVVVVLIAVFFLVLSICSFIIFYKARKLRMSIGALEDAGDSGTKDSLQLDFAAVSFATDNFSESNKLGEGGFGPVYKGKLVDGQEIAVKKLSKNSKQGDVEFKNEIILLSKLQHKNLVRLMGFCLAGSERLVVYELIPNASLDKFLQDDDKRAGLDWQTRYKIIQGIARGLLYLHQDSALPVIIHRDLKASNILLDAEMNPKISDFGMARLFSMDQTQCKTSKIVGTYGYMAPEYAMLGQISVKSDVYSFGVLVLELITGQMNNRFEDEETGETLFTYVWGKWREGEVQKIVDQVLGNYSSSEILRCIHIGLLCIQENALARPAMAAVELMLSTHTTTLTSPLRPAFLMHSPEMITSNE